MPFEGFPHPAECPVVNDEPEVFTLPHFAEWLGTKPADKRYCMFDTGACLLAAYTLEHGGRIRRGRGQAPSRYIIGEQSIIVSPLFRGDETPLHRVALYGTTTFGAALQRARALAATSYLESPAASVRGG